MMGHTRGAGPGTQEGETEVADIQVDVLTAAEDLVKDRFRAHDPSHDWHHVHRVRLMAISLSRCPSLRRQPRPDTAGSEANADDGGVDTLADLLVVELAALFHDMCDAKYMAAASGAAAGSGGQGVARAKDTLASFFAPFIATRVVAEEQVQLVYRIVDSVSWSKEEARRERMCRSASSGAAEAIGEQDRDQEAWEASCAEFKCVSDADRLDSIGSIGIMRVAAYSAAMNRPLHIPPSNARNDPVPPAEQAFGYNGSAVAHFYDKLLKIRGDRLKTDMARDEAERRQAMMSSFLTELDFEWTVADQGAQLALLDSSE